MDIERLKIKKSMLSDAILKMIRDFENETGVPVALVHSVAEYKKLDYPFKPTTNCVIIKLDI